MGSGEKTKELILNEAFILFMKNNYEKVTIADIEYATNQAKGTIFYHIKNKENLFRMVVDRFILETQSLSNKVENSDLNIPLHLFIKRYIEGINNTMDRFKLLMKESSDGNVNRYYFNLIFQASKYYAGFKEKVKRFQEEEIQIWIHSINYAIEIGEIKPETDAVVVAKMFHYVFYGLSYKDSLLEGLDTWELYELYLMIYKSVKK